MTQLPPAGAPQQPQQPPQPPPKKGMGTGAKIGLGCGAAVLAMVLLTCGGVFYLVSNARYYAGELGASALNETLAAADIPEDQKQRMIARVGELKEKFQAGDLGPDQLAAIGQRVLQGPILPVGAVMVVEQQYIASSALSDAEKADARRTLDRYARGLYEQSIDMDTLEQVIAPLSTTDAAGETELKTNPTTEELKQFLDLARQQADTASIPDEPFEVDLAAAFDQAVDDALAQTAPATP